MIIYKKINIYVILGIILLICYKFYYSTIFLIPFLYSIKQISFRKKANSHILITGSSGYGKSTLSKQLIKQINKKNPIIILDLHNEYIKHFKKYYSPLKYNINLWELNNESPNQKIQENISLIKSATKLGSIQQYFLEEISKECYYKKNILEYDKKTWKKIPPSNKDILELIKVKASYSNGQNKKSLLSLHRRLSSLENSGIFSSNNELNISDVIKKTSIFSLGDIKNDEAQKIFVEFFLRKLFKYKKQNKSKIHILIDEAQSLYSKTDENNSYLSKISSEARKYGINLIISTQMPSMLDRTIIANCSNKFAFYHQEPEDFEYIINMLSLTTDWKIKNKISKELNQLKKYEYIYFSNNQKFKGKTKKQKFIIKNKLINNTNLLSIIKKKKILSYDKLNPKYKKEANKLIKNNIINIETFKNLSNVPERFIGISEKSKSFEHFVYVNLISNYLRKNKIHHKIFDNAFNPDIEINGTAIEYETGKKKDLTQIKKMLEKRDKYNQIIIIVNPKAYNSFKQFRNKKVKIILPNQINKIIF